MKAFICFSLTAAIAGAGLSGDGSARVGPEVVAPAKKAPRSNQVLLSLPEVLKFWGSCGDDKINGYQNAEAWLLNGGKLAEMGNLKASELADDAFDKMVDILANHVEPIDFNRALEIIGRIQDEDSRVRDLEYLKTLHELRLAVPTGSKTPTAPIAVPAPAPPAPAPPAPAPPAPPPTPPKTPPPALRSGHRLFSTALTPKQNS